MSSTNKQPNDSKAGPSIRLLIVTDSPDRPETYLLEQLTKQGFEITMISRVCPKQLEGKLKFIEATIPSRISPKTILLIRRVCRSFKPEIIHSFTARAISNALLATIGLPIKHVAYRGTCGHLSRFDPASWLGFLNPRVSKISCISKAVAKYLHLQGVPESKLALIYKGHDLNWYQSVTPIDRSSLGIPADAVLIGFVGNMRPVKGADLLVQAFSRLTEPNVHLLLIGELRGVEENDAIALSALKKNIHVTGFRTDALSFLAACDFSVCPSRAREGLPKSVLEALALKVPVIVSDAGGCPEMVEDGVSGLIVKAGSVDELTAALKVLINDRELRKKLSEAGPLRIASTFTAQKTVAKTIELYRELI